MVNKDLVGKVIHYYDKIQVAVIRLTRNIKVGDKLKFVHGESTFVQVVKSMQLEHEQIENGKKGQEVAIKLDQVAKPNTEIFLE